MKPSSSYCSSYYYYRPSKTGMNVSLILVAILLFAFLSHHLYRDAHLHLSLSLSSSPPPPQPHFLSPPPSPPPLLSLPNTSLSSLPITTHSPSSSKSNNTLTTVSILIPDWQVLVLVNNINNNNIVSFSKDKLNFTCVFSGESYSPARFAGELPFNRGYAFTCEFPARNRRKLPFLQPRLVKSDQLSEEREKEENNNHPKELLKWNFLAYDTFTTENDVVLMVKGVNKHQGINRQPSDLRCVFGDDPSTVVKTGVTSSEQEVFRCVRPQLKEQQGPISVTLEIHDGTNYIVVPTVAQYAPLKRRTIEFEGDNKKSLICACTMVYNVGKFLKEWVTFHASIGVGKFILYDNDSDDDLGFQVRALNRAGFDVRTVYWPWPKTQEAGFSHCALYTEEICQWVGFVDVDEFILSPTWMEASKPRDDMLMTSLLPKGSNTGRVGQVSVKCNEFGPSGLTAHPKDGVTQGYTCRRKVDQRHKSLVLLEALHPSLLNVIHHFKLRDGYKSAQVGAHRAVVNHYKYQAWPEFQAKFRRRVSAYVVDWRQSLNPGSNDRAPGLGFEPVEPPGWAQRFCEVQDGRLKELTRRWFGLNSSTMAWQSA